MPIMLWPIAIASPHDLRREMAVYGGSIDYRPAISEIGFTLSDASHCAGPTIRPISRPRRSIRRVVGMPLIASASITPFEGST